MTVIGQIAALLAFLAAGITVALAVSQHLGRKSLSEKDPQQGVDPRLLADPRSCHQESLDVFRHAINKLDPEQPARGLSLELIYLLQANPHLAFAEVIDDRILLSIEEATTATHIWIVQSDESIEFEYPTAAVTFSEAVFKNLRRGIVYRYLVAQTEATRERAGNIIDLVRKDGFDDQLQIRFLPGSAWEKMAGKNGGWVAYGTDNSLDLFYRFPTPQSDTLRKWIRVPDPESSSRLYDLRSMWGSATPASVVKETGDASGAASPFRKDDD